MSVRVRFAPSPTGFLHVGNVRTALFNWFLAQQEQGTLVLRIEDTDAERSEVRFEEQLLNDLSWLGITWQEGVDIGGRYGPYRQTDRLSLYKQKIEKLLETGSAYHCFCSAERLEADRELMLQSGESIKYVGRCRNIPREEVKSRLESGEKATVRLRVSTGLVAYNDLVFGPIEVDCTTIGDFILARSDGSAQYNLACVVDDAEMKITHVIRGEGHISNTHRQILLYEALGYSLPKFAHLSTILGSDGTKLSKRHGATSISEFRRLGYLPEAIVNYLALLGWTPPEDTGEILSPKDLIQAFSMEQVNVSPATFDVEKLNWVNRSHLKKKSPEKITAAVIPMLVEAGLLPAERSAPVDQWAQQLIALFLNYLDRLSDLPALSDLVFNFDPEEDLKDPIVQEIIQDKQAREVVQFFRDELEQSGSKRVDWETYKTAVLSVKERTGQKGKNLFRPVRIAVTARASGPELDKLIPVLETGRELSLPKQVIGVLERVRRVSDQLGRQD